MATAEGKPPRERVEETEEAKMGNQGKETPTCGAASQGGVRGAARWRRTSRGSFVIAKESWA